MSGIEPCRGCGKEPGYFYGGGPGEGDDVRCDDCNVYAEGPSLSAMIAAWNILQTDGRAVYVSSRGGELRRVSLCYSNGEWEVPYRRDVGAHKTIDALLGEFAKTQAAANATTAKQFPSMCPNCRSRISLRLYRQTTGNQPEGWGIRCEGRHCGGLSLHHTNKAVLLELWNKLHRIVGRP